MYAANHTGKSARALVLEFRKLSRPQTIYVSRGKLSFPIVIYSSCLVNLVFWGNLSQWVYSDYAVLDENTSKYEKAPFWKRSAFSGLLAATGLGITAAFALVSKRLVRQIDIWNGGKSITLHTGFFAKDPLRRVTQVPIQELTLKKSMYTGQGINGTESSSGHYTQLLRNQQMIGYLVDRRGVFDAKVLDELFFLSR